MIIVYQEEGKTQIISQNSLNGNSHRKWVDDPYLQNKSLFCVKQSPHRQLSSNMDESKPVTGAVFAPHTVTAEVYYCTHLNVNTV